jgi:hypothetical protein
LDTPIFLPPFKVELEKTAWAYMSHLPLCYPIKPRKGSRWAYAPEESNQGTYTLVYVSTPDEKALKKAKTSYYKILCPL